MTLPTYIVPALGSYNTAEDPKIATALQQIYDILNGNVESANIANNTIVANDLATALAQQLGLSNALNTGRGKSIIATSEAHTSGTSYGKLATPDQVSGIVLPTDGFIHVAYQATWRESVAGNGRAAIFLHNGTADTQLKSASIATGDGIQPVATAAATTGSSNSVDTVIASFHGGLASIGRATASSYNGDVTTGQVVGIGRSDVNAAVEVNSTVINLTPPLGGFCSIFAAAGTYTVSVQFKSVSSGTVTVKNRKLWVWTTGF